jgi:hypothetical protein
MDKHTARLQGASTDLLTKHWDLSKALCWLHCLLCWAECQQHWRLVRSDFRQT